MARKKAYNSRDEMDEMIDEAIFNFFKKIGQKVKEFLKEFITISKTSKTSEQKGAKTQDKPKMKKGIIITLFIGIMAIIILSNSYTVIEGGYRGVVFSKASGIKDTILDEGFHFKTPIVDTIIKLEVRTKKLEVATGSTSFDQQIVNTKATLNYRINLDQVNKLYQEVGLDYESRIIKPAIEGTMKGVMAQYNAADLVQKRPEVSQKIVDALQEKLNAQYITVERFELVDIDYSEKYDAAIEAKQEAEQDALKAENELRRIEVEQKQKIAVAEADKTQKILAAKGNAEATLLNAEANAKAKLLNANAEAESVKLVNQQLQNSPQYVSYIKALNWNGILPQTLVTSEQDLLMSIN